MNIIIKINVLWMGALLLLCSDWVSAAQLSLNISGKNIKPGVLHIELYRVQKLHQKPLEWADITTVSTLTADFLSDAESVELAVDDIASGQLCVRVYVDLNANQQLDRSPMGLPLEPVGFANNPALFMGEPDPDAACFELLQGNNAQSIILQQKRNKK